MQKYVKRGNFGREHERLNLDNKQRQKPDMKRVSTALKGHRWLSTNVNLL